MKACSRKNGKSSVPEGKVMMTVDRGNTLAKVSVYDGMTCLSRTTFESMDIEDISAIVDRYGVESAIYAAVGHTDVRFVESLRMLLEGRLLVMTHKTDLPVEIAYRSRDTLGLDRIAAVVGGINVVGARPFVIADAGTCVTIDYFDGDRFVGGNICAGIGMRLRALSEMTARLPLVDAAGELPLIGSDTATALRCGAVRGIVAEIVSFVESVSRENGGAVLLLCGGDAPLLAPLIKENNMECVLIPDAVGAGLAAILDYNEKKSN